MKKIHPKNHHVNYLCKIYPSMVRLAKETPMPKGLKQKLKDRPTRGIIQGLTVSSGIRLQETIARLDPDQVPYFVTLTYPNEWNQDWRKWKIDLNNFQRALKDDFPGFKGALWRLEAQKRGAPHYHILVYVDGTDQATLRAWTAKRWYKIVGSGDKKHLDAGTQVDVVENHQNRTMKTAMAYIGKYVGKTGVNNDSAIFGKPVGRFWGIWGKENILIDPEKITLDKESFNKARRALKTFRKKNTSKKLHSKSYSMTNKGKFQKTEPGLRAFMDSKNSHRLIDYADPPPF